jgi:ABC-2 family transporter protein
MSAIARKSSYFFLSHLVTFSVPGFAEVFRFHNRGMLWVMALWVPAWFSSAVLWSEKVESYAFLRTLPVTDREIVRTKFGLTLGFATVYWLILFLYGRVVLGTTPAGSSFQALAVLICAVSLLLAGGWYLFSWRFGPTALTVAVLVFIVLVLFGTLAGVFEGGIRSPEPELFFSRQLSEGPWIYQALVAAAALAAYYGLMRAAVRVKEKSEAYL